jgi:DNA modification methylase
MKAPRNTILVGDAARRLRGLATDSVDCVITSPPYYQLRDYGVPGQLGLEPTVEDWVSALGRVFEEVARVLKPTGSLWLDLADSYSRHPAYGAPAKALLLAPERLLLALAATGWRCRNKVVWSKTNPMPHSVADRLSTTYDVIYFLVRSHDYYFDLDAIRLPHRSRQSRSAQPAATKPPVWAGPLAGTNSGLHRARPAGQPGHPLGKNPGDVWPLPTRGFRGAHFATFPRAVVERPMLAACPERICARCGQPWKRAKVPTETHGGTRQPAAHNGRVRRYPRRWETVRWLGSLAPDCICRVGTLPGLVLDPFFGSGTVGLVAEEHDRDWLGIELNPEYVELAWARLGRQREQARDPGKRVAA